VWTREKLAKKFNCSNLFVGIVCEASRKRREGQQQILEAVKLKWGRRRRIAREDRVKRRETWEGMNETAMHRYPQSRALCHSMVENAGWVD
jgi:hypothetical protein